MGNFVSYSMIRGTYNLLMKYGLCSGDELENWLGSLIAKLTGNKDITFLQLYNKYNKKLIITGTDIQQRKIDYFSHINNPDMLIRTAIRISTSIPFLFAPVHYNNTVYVDGGVLENFPFKACDMCSTDDSNAQNILGMILMNDRSDVGVPINGLVSFIKSLVDCYIAQPEENIITGDDWRESIKIPCGKTSSTDFSITDQVKKDLANSGRQAVINYFNLKHAHESDLKNEIM